MKYLKLLGPANRMIARSLEIIRFPAHINSLSLTLTDPSGPLLSSVYLTLKRALLTFIPLLSLTFLSYPLLLLDSFRSESRASLLGHLSRGTLCWSNILTFALILWAHTHIYMSTFVFPLYAIFRWLLNRFDCVCKLILKIYPLLKDLRKRRTDSYSLIPYFILVHE